MQQSMHDRQRRTPLAAMFFVLVAASAAGAAEIHDAARAGDVEKVRAILRQDAKQLSALDEHGATPLHVAKDAATARVLLEAHAPLDVKDAEGRTPVDAAAADGRIEVAAEIVGNLVKTLEAIQRMGGALSGVKPGSADAAALAVQDRDLAALAAVIERNTDVVHQRTEKQKVTPLEYAVIGHWVDGTKLLLERGADPNVKDRENDSTPLHETAAQGRDDVAVVLLDHGAKIDAKSDEGLTPLHAAAMEGKREMVRLLLMRGADTGAKVHGLTALQLARRGKHHDAVHFLELHEKLGKKRFAASIQLLSASWRGDMAEIERIAGNDRELLSVRTEFGYTPLHKAVEGKQPLAVAALVRLGANPGAKADAGTTPLELAKDPETIAALQQGGAYTAADFEAWMSAAAEGNLETLRVLADQAPKIVDAKNKHLCSALHWAAGSCQVAAVQFLLSRGANPKLKDDYDETPQATAKRRKFAPTPEGNAKKQKCAEVIEVLKKHKS